MSAVGRKAKENLLMLLREVMRQVQSLDDVQLEEVAAGTAKLEVRVVASKRSSPSPKHSRLTDEELHQLGDALRSIRTREDGNQLLDEKITSKEDMARLARLLDIPVQKSDSAEQIRARIIESTIGFRIRSAAIQGVAGGTSNKPGGSTE